MKTSTWKGNNWKTTIDGYDTKAYYSYLPEFFVNHNLIITDSTLPYVNVINKQIFNKHFVGPAVLWSPFFLATLEYARLQHKDSDMYSALFVKGIGIAALFWLFIGLYCLWGILKFFNISDPVISLTLFLIVFGTNLFYYVFNQYMMAHMYSFSMLSVFLYTGMKYSRTEKKQYLVLMSMAFGLSVIIRPTSICVLPCLLPLMCGDIKKTMRTFFTPVSLFIAISIIVPILFLQCGTWYMQTGHWFVRAYSSEGFYFLHPQIFNVLLSFQNGWFVYTPLALISLFGLVNLYQINKVSFYSCFLAIIVWLYLVSCWWCWSYEDGFEHRAFIDIYALVAIGMAHLFPSAKNKIYAFASPLKKKIISGSLLLGCGLFLTVSLIQTYQYCNNIMFSYWMDWDCYKYVFLKTSDKYIDCLGGFRDLPPYTIKPTQLVISSKLNFTQGQGWRFKAPERLNGKPAIHFEGDDFGTVLDIPSDSVYNKGERYYAIITLTRFEPEGNSSSGVLFVSDVTGADNKNEYYKSFKINDYPSGKDSNTRTYQYELDTPGLIHKDSKMRFYIWNKDRQNFYLTGLSIEIYRCFP